MVRLSAYLVCACREGLAVIYRDALTSTTVHQVSTASRISHLVRDTSRNTQLTHLVFLGSSTGNLRDVYVRSTVQVVARTTRALIARTVHLHSAALHCTRAQDFSYKSDVSARALDQRSARRLAPLVRLLVSTRSPDLSRSRTRGGWPGGMGFVRSLWSRSHTPQAVTWPVPLLRIQSIVLGLVAYHHDRGGDVSRQEVSAAQCPLFHRRRGHRALGTDRRML